MGIGNTHLKPSKKLLAQLTKFGVVGVIATLIDFLVLIVLTSGFRVNYLVSATVAFVVSLVFNYLGSMRYVFVRKDGMSRQREFTIFVVFAVLGLGINDLVMFLGTGKLGFNYVLIKVVATALVMGWNFITRKIFLDAS